MTSSAITPFNFTEEDINLINKYSIRKLKPEDVYALSVILCDNNIDRDGEAFTSSALTKLAEIFPGKTGILDHDSSSKNQISRLYKAAVEHTGKKTVYGDDEVILKANAYIPKSKGTNEIIEKIDTGILKEVSISCSIKNKNCSICGKRYNGSCNHIIGKSYNGNQCYIKLENPVDAFEWSFVAVPAQVGARVVKNFTYSKNKNNNNNFFKDKNYEYYENSLKSQVIKLSLLSKFMIDNDSFKDIVDKLSIKELEAFKEELSKNINDKEIRSTLSASCSSSLVKKENDLDFII